MTYEESCKLLDADISATKDELKKAYRQKIRFYHPDNFQGDADKMAYAEQMTKNLNEAWNIIEHCYGNSHSQHSHNNYETDSKNINVTETHIYVSPFDIIKIVVILLIVGSVLITGITTGIGNALSGWFIKVRNEIKYSDEELSLMEQYEFAEYGEGYSVTAITLLSGSVSIPEAFDGRPIVAIAEKAFKNSSIETILIPATVEYIGVNAFQGCEDLATVTFSIGESAGASLVIDESAFAGCSNLSSITLPSVLTTLGEEAFYGCSSLTSIVIPDSVTEMGTEVFRECSSLRDITLSKGLSYIPHGSFNCCMNLETVSVSENIKYIDEFAFHNCSNLAKVYLPNGIDVYEYAFYGCKALNEIVYDGTMDEWKSKTFAEDFVPGVLTIAVQPFVEIITCSDGVIVNEE